MAEYLDHKDIDELVDHNSTPMMHNLPGIDTWQDNWCINIDADVLDRELIDELESGGWEIYDENTYEYPNIGICTLVRWIPTEDNVRMYEWEKRENEHCVSDTGREVFEENSWRAFKNNDIDMDDQHSRPL